MKNLYLDNMIRCNDPNQSLDNVMVDLFYQAPNKKKPLLEFFKDIVKKYTPHGIDEEILHFVQQGNTIDLKNLTKYLPINELQMGRFELGFDRNKFINSKIIKNINTESNAYKAGLRNGDVIASYDFPNGQDPYQTVTIVKASGEIIKYRPEGARKYKIYQLKNNLSAYDKQQLIDFWHIQPK